MTWEEIKNELKKAGSLRLKVKVVTASARIGILGEMSDGTVRIGLHSVPEKGKANLELIRLIEHSLAPFKAAVKIISGMADRRKIVKIDIL